MFPNLDFDVNRSSTIDPYDTFSDDSDRNYFQRLPHQVEVFLLNINFCLQLYPTKAFVSRIMKLNIRDIEIIDNVRTSQWKKFLAYRIPLPEESPRPTDSDLIHIEWTGVRADSSRKKEEFILRVKILPIQMHIDQDTVSFLESYFHSNDELSDNASAPYQPPEDTAFFRKKTLILELCEIDPITIQIDYKPKHVDFANIQEGKFIEMINFLHLDGATFYLKRVKVTGIYGWSRLLNRTLDIWLPHIKETQIPQIASGVTGLKSIMNISSGIADLVLLPIEQFKKDGRIVRGNYELK